MLINTKKSFVFTLILSLLIHLVTAQNVHEPSVTNHPDWTKPYPPFQIAGNLYYVGTYDLGCYLITTDNGHILINTGVASSAATIKQSVEQLGFNFSDIKILLTTQVHYDHVGAMAAIKNETGAQMMVDEKDADVLADGGSSDYVFGGKGALFQPLKADRLLHDRDTIRLANMKVVMLHHPGHTKGSCSFLFDVKDKLKKYRVLIANLPTIVVDKKFSEVTAYPNIASDYAYTFRAMKNISFDIWLASHAGQFDLESKHKPGGAYNPDAFKDRQGYDKALNEPGSSIQAKAERRLMLCFFLLPIKMYHFSVQLPYLWKRVRKPILRLSNGLHFGCISKALFDEFFLFRTYCIRLRRNK